MVLAALVVAAVVAVDPVGLAPFGPLRWALVPTLVLAALATTTHVRVPRAIAIGWALFLALVAVAAVRGLDPLYAWIGTPERRFGALTWLLCAVAFAAGTGERRRALLTGAAAVACGIAGVWACFELVGIDPVDVIGTGDRPIGPLGSSAYLGAAMCLLVPVAIARHERWAYACAALGGVALLASGARAAWLGAVVAALWWAWRQPSHRRYVVAAVAVLAVTAIATGRGPDLLTDERGGIAGRLDEWRVAAGVIADHPLTGTGPEGYRIAFGSAVDDAYEIEHGRDPLPDRAHSAPLDVAATIGIPGLVAYAALVVLVARRARRDLVAVGVLAYAVQSLALFPLAELDPVAWALAGTLVVAERPTTRVRIPVRAIAGVAAAITLVVGGLDVLADRAARNGDGARAADLRPDALRYHLVEAAEHRVVGDEAGALAALDRALDVSPDDPVVRSERADVLLELDPARALDALEDLVDDDPRNAEVLLRLGLARLRNGDRDGARAAWLDAERLASDSTAATENLARLDFEEDGT
ncbi:MAG TPA: O-antigen ligase family protein [Acidimicrobiales bacterium]|nr:O-antigen ligase family protein [Acidimicrobiales bacterium]